MGSEVAGSGRTSRARAAVARAITSASLVAALVCFVGRAAADEPAPNVEPAKAAFTIGVDLFDQGDFRGAARAFARANELRPSAIYKYNLGLAYDRLEDSLRVVEIMSSVVAAPGALKPERVQRAEEILTKARARVGRLEIVCAVDGARVDAADGPLGACPFTAPILRRPGVVYLHAVADGFAPLYLPVEVRPGEIAKVSLDLVAQERPLAAVVLETRVPGATVFVDGVEVGQTPLASSLPITAGEDHTIEIRRRGYATAKQSVRLERGASSHVALDPTVDDVALASEGARLDVRVAPDGARLLVDGRPLEMEGQPVVPPGRHELLVSRSGYEPWTSEVDLDPGATRRIDLSLVPTTETRADLRASARSRRTAGWALLGTGLGLVGVGAPLLIYNRVDASSVADARRAYDDDLLPALDCHPMKGGELGERCTAADVDIRKDEQRVQALDVATGIGIATGVALGVVGVVIIATGDDPGRFGIRDPEDYAALRRSAPKPASLELRAGPGSVSLRVQH